ncbi:microtubule organization protein AKNA isoform X2 [Mugil cephalus]|uniref:microtubule organization protein AKNA isoform X2 n=1 Tax=Mugil cephalus TaxID=48193 RepID=UPI001FB75B1F|nr:microtubule organization protein AKNA isoform X2 [Mugil cephalus]
METRRNTTAGVVFWTPAPVRTPSASAVASEDDWEDEDAEQAEGVDDFDSLMDENGIIGLSEPLDDVELREARGDIAAEWNPGGRPGALTPEEVGPSGCERDTPPEELSYNLSEQMSHNESSGEDVQIQSSCYDMTGNLEAWTQHEEQKEQEAEPPPEWDEYLGMTEEERDGEEEGQGHGRNGKIHDHFSQSGPLHSLCEGSISERENLQTGLTRSYSVPLPSDDLAEVSAHYCPESHAFPHLLHFTAEELASAPGIEAETFPEMGFTESLPESHCSHMSLKSSPRSPDTKLSASPQPAAAFPERVMTNNFSRVNNGPVEGSGKLDERHKQPIPAPRKTRQHSSEVSCSGAGSRVRTDSVKSKQYNTKLIRDKGQMMSRSRNTAVEEDESRKGPLSYQTPDFSKVEPRVCFPKGGYKPPRSRRSFMRDSLSPAPPLVFKSPAEIVEEVLLNTTDGSHAPSDFNRPPAANSIVPQEFRCPEQATTLLVQFQEDYKRLLTKYAEAENTIDRLRLEAKNRDIENQQPRSRQCQRYTVRAVNLYSDPPKAGHSVQSGLRLDASKFITLDFPQAQRAQVNSASLCPDEHSAPQGNLVSSPSTRSPDPQLGQQLADILFSQTDKFFQQLQTFEDLLKSKKLQPSEQIKGLTQLAEGLDSLERGYLLARDEHKLLQQRGVDVSHFDPDRELEGLIFQCGLAMEELKEQVEQMRQEQPTCEAPPSPPPQPTPSPPPSEEEETLTLTQSPPVPLLVGPGDVAEVEVSSVSKESEEEAADEEAFYLKHLNDNGVEQDFTVPVVHHESFKGLPILLDCKLMGTLPSSAALKMDMQPVDKEEERRGQRTGNSEVRKPLPQRKGDADFQDFPSTSKQHSSRSSPPSHRASSQSTKPVLPSSSRKSLSVVRSHSSSLSSLGDITASEMKSSKLQTGCRRVPSQDGVISPETDSGFVGSESSRLTPAAAPRPLHQRPPESVSVDQEVNTGRQTGPVSASSPSSSRSHCRTAKEPRVGLKLNPDLSRRTRQGQRRRTFSCSPQRRVSQSEQTRLDGGTTRPGSEGEQSDQYTESFSSIHSSHLSSSSPARYHHGDPLRALSSSERANCKEAIQTLQTEVTRLKDKLDSCLKNKKSLSSVRTTLSAQRNGSHTRTSTPLIRSGEQQRDFSVGRRETQTVDEVEEESTLRPTTRKTSASAHRQRPQLHTLTRSELIGSSTPSPQVSRHTQTPAAPDSHCSHTTTVGSRRIQPRQHPVVSVHVSEPSDEPDSRRSGAPVCLLCHGGRSERPVGGNKEPLRSSAHCPHCGRLHPSRCTEPDCCRHSRSPSHISWQPAESPDRTASGRYFAAAASPALLHYMPVCPPQLLLYSSPLYVPPTNGAGPSSGVRSSKEVRGRTRRSQSVDKQRSVDSSLDRAISAARHMKHTSRHMARSLATGLQYQELLTQSCSY